MRSAAKGRLNKSFVRGVSTIRASRREGSMGMSVETSTSGFARARNTIAASSFVVVLAITSAFAAGGTGGGGNEGASGASGAPKGAQSKGDLTTCRPGEVWDKKKHTCLRRHSGVLADPEMTEYAFALASADRYQEALD